MRILKSLFIISISLLFIPTPLHAQTDVPTQNAKQTIKLVRESGLDGFVKELNESGKKGYRLERSAASGDEGNSQTFAAVLRHDADNTYEYEWFSSPNKNLLESRLNAIARTGFKFANSHAITACNEEDSETDTPTGVLFLKVQKGDAFLMERTNGALKQRREYKVFVGKIGLGKSPSEAIQTALNNMPRGFHPVKISFSKTGMLDLAVLVLLENDLDQSDHPTIDYRFVKEVNGFEKTVNGLAAQGYRILSGRRVGMVKFALMAKDSNVPTTYTFIDKEKYAKQFDLAVSQGYRFETITGGDLDCGSSKAVNEKIVLSQETSAQKYNYAILPVTDASEADINTKIAEGFQPRGLFFHKTLNVILEK